MQFVWKVRNVLVVLACYFLRVDRLAKVMLLISNYDGGPMFVTQVLA